MYVRPLVETADCEPEPFAGTLLSDATDTRGNADAGSARAASSPDPTSVRPPADRTWSRLRLLSLDARIATLLIVGYLVLVAVNAAPLGHLNTGDTNLLVQGARQTVECLSRGTLVGCGHAPGSVETKVGPYALLQYLPAVAMVKFGLTNNQVVEALGRISFAAFVGSLVIVVAIGRRLQPGFWTPILVLALIGSSLTYQSTSGFGEMLAAFSVLLAVAAVLWRRPLLIATTMVFATTGKETLFPFILALGLLAGRRRSDGVVPPWRVWLPMVLGIAVGEFLNLGFNVFRFGVDKNLTYLQPILRTPGLERKAGLLAALWFAPSGGLLWFWPLTTVLVIAVAIATMARLARAPSPLVDWLPPLLAIATLVAFTAVLTDWFSPFGWIAYGPRLIVPLLPASTVVILYTGGPLLASPVRFLLSHTWAIFLTGVVVAAVGWAQFGTPWSWLPAIGRLETASPGCPIMTKLIIQNGVNRYYHCTGQVEWRIRPSVLVAAATEGGAYAVAARLTLAIASILLIADFARRTRGRRWRLHTQNDILGESIPSVRES